jgi:PrtD family type I secretion system ABC transporter
MGAPSVGSRRLKLFGIELPEPLAGGVRACRLHFIGALVFSAFLNVLLLAPPIYMLQVYDRVLPTSGLATLVFVTIIVAIALITLSILDAVRARILVRMSLRFDRMVSGPLLERLIARVVPGAPSQGMREFDTLRGAISGPAALGILDAPWAPLYVIVSFMLHPALGLLTIVGGIILANLAVLNERATKTIAQEASKATIAAYSAQEAVAMNSEFVRALGMRGALRDRQLSERRTGLALSAQAQFTSSQFAAATKFVRLFLQSGSLGLGAWLAVEGQISAGGIIAASILMSRALQPIEQIVGSWGAVVQARSALRTLSGLFAANPEPETGRTLLPNPKGRLTLDKVVVRTPGYPDQLLLKGVGFVLEPGEVLGIIGPSGSGKSTLARVAAGAFTPDMGVVRLDGASMSDWEPDRLGQHIGYLPQDTCLIAGSIRDNISRFAAWRLGASNGVDVAVVAAAKSAGIHDLILKLPKGYDSHLTHGGRGLSAGQAQRVALARALYGNPELLVLDEPNSALDADGEAALSRAIDAARARGAAVLIVAHRTGILQTVDRLLVLRDGSIEMIGSREEVLGKMSQPRGRGTPSAK